MKRNQVLMRLMTWKAEIFRATQVEHGGITTVEYETIHQDVPCKLSQGVGSRMNLVHAQQDDVAKLNRTAKGFFDWTADICAGDRVRISHNGEEVGIYEVGEVFCYRDSHKECALSRTMVI